jgi:LysR family transcriptional regulator, nitrogen assimilation regulatory protein
MRTNNILTCRLYKLIMTAMMPHKYKPSSAQGPAISEAVGSLAPMRAPRALMESIDLKEIRCFVAAYEEGSFSMAAKREHCTQPGLSVHIQRLESLLAHRLFDRRARGVTPTIAGAHFYASCTDVLKSVYMANQRMLDLAGSVAAQINVGISPSLLKGGLTRTLPEYLALHPYVDVRLSEAYSGTLIDWVVSGDVQAAIVTKPPVHLGLETTHFFRDRLVLVSRGSGRPPRRRIVRQRSVRELGQLKLILPSPKHNLRQVIENAVRLGTTGAGKVLEIDGMLSTFEIVRNSDWSTVIAGFAVMDEVKQGSLVADALCDPELWIDFYLVRTKGMILSVACQQFLDLLKQNLKQISGS